MNQTIISDVLIPQCLLCWISILGFCWFFQKSIFIIKWLIVGNYPLKLLCITCMFIEAACNKILTFLGKSTQYLSFNFRIWTKISTMIWFVATWKYFRNAILQNQVNLENVHCGFYQSTQMHLPIFALAT